MVLLMTVTALKELIPPAAAKLVEVATLSSMVLLLTVRTGELRPNRSGR